MCWKGFMKIDKEKFNKLNQLDRIEFRQKVDLIKEKYPTGVSSAFWFITITGLLMLNIGFSGYSDFGADFLLSFSDVSYSLLKIAFLFFILELGFIIYYSFRRIKAYEKLSEEYFKVEVKKNKK